MQFIFFVPPNEELEGTLHPQKFGCTPKNEGKRYMYPQMKKPVGILLESTSLIIFFFFIIGKTGNSRSRLRNPIPLFHFRNFR
jgi:hypothetical protein